MLAADLSTQGLFYANSLDPDQAQQNVGLDLRSKLFDILILFLQREKETNHKLKKKNHLLQNFK